MDGVVQQVLQQGEEGAAIRLPWISRGSILHQHQAYLGGFGHALQIVAGFPRDIDQFDFGKQVVPGLTGFGEEQQLLDLTGL